MKKKPLILITNDDSIIAPGIRMVIEIMKEIGDTVVVAPDKPQSGMGHAITVNATLEFKRIKINEQNHREYTCSGTPADCVKIAKNEILDRKPDICISGINHGSNASLNVIYSGTMSAAIEAGIENIPSIGFSICNFSWEANLNPFKKYVKNITMKVLENGLPKGTVLNVNCPNTENIKGIKICRQAKGIWKEKFEKREKPFVNKEPYYWITGEFIDLEKGNKETDLWALENDYISIVPVQFDLTAYHAIEKLNRWVFQD